MIKISLRIGLVDRENARSLHTGDQPRGGGLGLVLSLLVVQIGWVLIVGFPDTNILIWWGLSLGVSILGLRDDHTDISALARLLTQIILALVFCVFVIEIHDPYREIKFFFYCIFIVWGINGANFMDGIDGMLASQALVVFLVLLSMSASLLFDVVGVTIIGLAGACLGFLVWNWHPSKIFLGDVGSYFLGFMISTSVLLLGQEVDATFPLFICLIPLYCDSTLTFMKRLLSGERFWEAHRSHLYQLLVLRGLPHYRTTALYLFASLGIFLPLALWAKSEPRFAIPIFFAASLAAAAGWLFCYRYVAAGFRN